MSEPAEADPDQPQKAVRARVQFGLREAFIMSAACILIAVAVALTNA
jgi:hypothetical protein